MFEQTERHMFFLVLGFQRIRRLSYHATQGFNLLLVSIMVDVPSSLRMLKGPSSYFTFIPVWLVYDLCNWLFADEKRMRKTQDSQFPSHPRHSTATDPGVFLQRHPRQKRVWSWWSMGHLNRFPISGQPKWTISKRLGSTNLHPNMYPFIHWKHKRLDGGYIVVPKYVGNNCSQISLVERSPTFFFGVQQQHIWNHQHSKSRISQKMASFSSEKWLFRDWYCSQSSFTAGSEKCGMGQSLQRTSMFSWGPCRRSLGSNKTTLGDAMATWRPRWGKSNWGSYLTWMIPLKGFVIYKKHISTIYNFSIYVYIYNPKSHVYNWG